LLNSLITVKGTKNNYSFITKTATGKNKKLKT